MLSLQHETRPDVLREVAMLIDRDNQRLRREMRELRAELDRRQGRDMGLGLQIELDWLKEVLAKQNHKLFGRSSERRPLEPSCEPEPRPAQKGHGPNPQLQLPQVDRAHELAPDQRTCPGCGGTLETMSDQSEDSEEITVVERVFVTVRHRRQKYRCRCNGAVVTAPGPKRLIPGGRYSPAFAVEVATSKYLDHLPLDRQRRIFEREGLAISSQTLWDQIEALAKILEPTYKALGDRVLAEPVVHADETHWKLLKKGTKATFWVWCLASQDVVFYRILDSRSKDAAEIMMPQYEGTVIADGYGAYQALARAGPGLQLAHCWAHVRRKFLEAERFDPEPCREILDLIGQLYAVEREVPTLSDPADEKERAEQLALRTRLRQESSRPLVDQIRTWAEAQEVRPRSSVGDALRYLRELWPGLIRFLDDARIGLDNNPVERALRSVVLGRKNHLGSRSRRGCDVAALFYTLLGTAQLRGVDPKKYLLRALDRALDDPTAVTYP